MGKNRERVEQSKERKNKKGENRGERGGNGRMNNELMQRGITVSGSEHKEQG